jgi:hypothetical protein
VGGGKEKGGKKKSKASLNSHSKPDLNQTLLMCGCVVVWECCCVGWCVVWQKTSWALTTHSTSALSWNFNSEARPHNAQTKECTSHQNKNCEKINSVECVDVLLLMRWSGRLEMLVYQHITTSTHRGGQKYEFRYFCPWANSTKGVWGVGRAAMFVKRNNLTSGRGSVQQLKNH